LQVLRTSEMARNIHALVRIRDQDENKMAAVAAVKALERMDDDAMPPAGAGSSMTPGFTIVVEQPRPPASPRPVIDVTPLRRPE
jgi:hypothetical protein